MTVRWPILLSCLLLPSAAAAAVHGVRPPFSVMPAAQSVAPGQSAEGRRDGGERVPGRSVAVVPFLNISRDTADDWIGDGIAETVAADLESLGGLVVIGRNVVASALGADVPRSLDAAAAARLGRGVGVGWVVTGGYQRVGQRLRITARLVDVRTGLVAETLTADGTLDEIFILQDQIVAELAAGLAAGQARTLPARRAAVGRPGVGAGSRGEGEGDDPRDADQFSRGRADRAAAGVVPPPVTGGIILPGGEPAGRAGGRGSGRGGGVPGRGPGAGGTAPAASAGVLTGRPSVTAVFANEPPLIDGQLDDAIWQRAAVITEFVQTSPVEVAPATEDTEVYFAFDSTHLYLAMYAHYSNPGMMRANRVDRDRASFSDDTISVYFDTFLDQQRAFVFTLNGYGVQGDSLMGGGQRGGGGFRGGGSSRGTPRGDSSWDVLFDSSGTLVDDGWTAEMAIPFKSLRYPSGDTHRWGFQIARSIRGKAETVVWSPVSRDVSGFMPQMGLLDGLRGLSTSRNFEILPTVTAIQVGSLDRATGGFAEERQPEGGLNFKYGLTSNLTLDFTYNPDFSQIESDRPQIEVNRRFPLGPSLTHSRNWNFDDVLEDESTSLRLSASFARNISFNGSVRREMERFGGIDFFKTRYSFSGIVSTSRVVSFGGRFNWGQQVRFSGTPFLGDSTSGSARLSLRLFSRLQASLNMTTSRLIDPLDQTEVFDVKIFRTQTTYQFTDRFLLRNIMEYNTFNRTIGANLLFTYRVNSGTVFYLGYDDRYRQGDLLFDDDGEPLFFTTDFERTSRAIFTKISYLFRY